jgi:hypothetical protein
MDAARRRIVLDCFIVFIFSKLKRDKMRFQAVEWNLRIVFGIPAFLWGKKVYPYLYIFILRLGRTALQYTDFSS